MNGYKKINELEDIFIREMKDSGIPFLRNGGTRILPGLLSLSFEGKDGEAILHRLDLLGISVSTGSACDNVKSEISHVLKSINLGESKAKGTIRISLGKYNTVNDIKKIVAALKRILK